MTRILVLWTLLIPTVYGQPAGDPDSDPEVKQQEQLPLQVEIDDLKDLVEKIRVKYKEEGDTGLHADAAEEEGPDEKPEDDVEAGIEDVEEDFKEELVIIEESVPLEPPVPFLPPPEGWNWHCER